MLQDIFLTVCLRQIITFRCNFFIHDTQYCVLMEAVEIHKPNSFFFNAAYFLAQIGSRIIASQNLPASNAPRFFNGNPHKKRPCPMTSPCQVAVALSLAQGEYPLA